LGVVENESLAKREEKEESLSLWVARAITNTLLCFPTFISSSLISRFYISISLQKTSFETMNKKIHTFYYIVYNNIIIN